MGPSNKSNARERKASTNPGGENTRCPANNFRRAESEFCRFSKRRQRVHLNFSIHVIDWLDLAALLESIDT